MIRVKASQHAKRNYLRPDQDKITLFERAFKLDLINNANSSYLRILINHNKCCIQRKIYNDSYAFFILTNWKPILINKSLKEFRFWKNENKKKESIYFSKDSLSNDERYGNLIQKYNEIICIMNWILINSLI